MSKVEELLAAISLEYNSIAQDINSSAIRNQKEFEIKLNQQLNEMQQMRNTVYELELTHRKMKESFEEEINRLKIDINQRDHQISSINAFHQQNQQTQQQRPHLHQHEQQQKASLPAPPIVSSQSQALAGGLSHPQPSFSAINKNGSENIIHPIDSNVTMSVSSAHPAAPKILPNINSMSSEKIPAIKTNIK